MVKKFEDMLTRFDAMYERDRQTDTDTTWQHRARLQSIVRQILVVSSYSVLKPTQPPIPSGSGNQHWSLPGVGYD